MAKESKQKEVEESAPRTGVKIVEKNKREQIHIFYQEYKGRKLFNIRVFAKNKEDEFVPTPKGLTIDPDLVEDLVAAIEASVRKDKKSKTVKE